MPRWSGIRSKIARKQGQEQRKGPFSYQPLMSMFSGPIVRPFLGSFNNPITHCNLAQQQ